MCHRVWIKTPGVNTWAQFGACGLEWQHFFCYLLISLHSMTVNLKYSVKEFGVKFITRISDQFIYVFIRFDVSMVPK